MKDGEGLGGHTLVERRHVASHRFIVIFTTERIIVAFPSISFCLLQTGYWWLNEVMGVVNNEEKGRVWSVDTDRGDLDARIQKGNRRIK